MTAEQIAPIVHEAMRAFQKVLGQPVTPAWDEATWEKDSSIEAVKLALSDPTPGQQHERWMQERKAAGWVFGPAKDNEKKTNPALVPFEDLPEAEQAKDTLVISIAEALKDVEIAAVSSPGHTP